MKIGLKVAYTNCFTGSKHIISKVFKSDLLLAVGKKILRDGYGLLLKIKSKKGQLLWTVPFIKSSSLCNPVSLQM